MKWWVPLVVLCFMAALSAYTCWFGWNAGVDDAIMLEDAKKSGFYNAFQRPALWPGAVMVLGAIGAGLFGCFAWLYVRITRWEMSYRYLKRRFENEPMYDILAETYRRRGHSVSRLDGACPMLVAERSGSRMLVCIDAKSPYTNWDDVPNKAFANVKAMREHMGAAGIKSGLYVSYWNNNGSLKECSKAAGIKLVSVGDLGMMAYRTRKRGDVIVKEPDACKRCGIVH